MKKVFFSLAVLALAASFGFAQSCPAITVADDMGVLSGAFPQQYDLSEFQELADCTLAFSENPAIADLNAQIIGNSADLPAVADRLPAEALVVAPYTMIGSYGGTLNGISKATESGTSDLLSIRHVNLVRFSDDLQTIVPNVAKSWMWNDDFTQLTFHLRAGHKWSDGVPFTAEDIAFWYNDMTLNTNIIEKPQDRFLVSGEPMVVEAVDATTVTFTLPAPKPGLLAQFAVDYAQPFQPKHFLGQFHPDINPDADALASEVGFESGYEVIAFYFGGSDWKDVPSPLLRDETKVANLPAAVVPTLEAYITVADTAEGRHYVANPYFFMVDTAGNQLPYINEMDEVYIADEEVQTLQMVNGDIDYKTQAVNLNQAPVLLDNQASGSYSVDLPPTVTSNVAISFNLTAADEAKRAVFNDVRFRQAMSHAINRGEIIEIAYLGEGAAEQYTAFDPATVSFISDEQRTAFTSYEPDAAAALLDEVGVIDQDGDGMRDLPNGDAFKLNIQFSTQGTNSDLPEVVANNWSALGIDTTATEVTSDEYRAAQSANELDVHIWTKGQLGFNIASDPGYFIPPFDSYFGHRNGVLWSQYEETDGAEGVEPPAVLAETLEKVFAFQGVQFGTDESNTIGSEIVDDVLEQLYFIGTVGSIPAPVYYHNNLGNFRSFTAKTYDFYWAFPYRPNQWFLNE